MPSIQQHQNSLSLPQVRAFLDTISWAEGANYNTLYGGGTFSNYSRHPCTAITKWGYTSTAAGRYQFLCRTWNGIANKLGLPDFSPNSQDIAALELIAERGQLNKLLNGNIEGVLRGLGCAWAALPFSGCGQRERSFADTMAYYNRRLSSYGGTANAPSVASTFSNAPVVTAEENNDTLYILLALGALLLLG